MNRTIAAAAAFVAALALAGCGNSSSSTTTPDSAAPTPAAASATAAGYSNACRKAALDWQSKATEALVGLTIGTSASDLADGMEQLQNHAHVECGDSSALYKAMGQAAYTIGLVDADLAVSGTVPKADQAKLDTANAQVKKVRELAQ